MSEREEWMNLIRNEYDPAPDHYRMGEDWDDGAGRIADAILADRLLLLRKHAEEVRTLTESMPSRGNYEDRHPNDMVLHPLTEIREWDEALAVLGIQDDDKTPADAIRELQDTIERMRDMLASVPYATLSRS